MKGPYQFNPDDAYRFASEQGSHTKKSGDELHFTYCPYCRGGSSKDKDTFSINLKTGLFKCLRASCGASGNMIRLAKDFDFSLGEVDAYYFEPRWRRFGTLPKKEPEDVLLKYFSGRGISKETVEKYQLRLKKDTENIIVFPFLDEAGELTFAKYRRTDFDKNKHKSKEWCEENCKPIAFGMYQCNLENRTLILTEGQIDSLSVAEAGFENAISVPNGCNSFKWVTTCWNWLHNFDTLIVFGDHEKGHITLLDEMKQRFVGTVKHVRPEDYNGHKDANEILMADGPKQIAKCIENAVALPINHLAELADVQLLDLNRIKRFSTGIRRLDKQLHGGIPFGSVTLLAGKPGEGKSTLASQFCVNAVAEGYKVLAYSGELSNGMFKVWFDCQIAGPAHLHAHANYYGDEDFELSDTNRRLISEWYRGKMFIYDSTITEDDDLETEDLLEFLQKAIIRNKIQVVLIDNLMTAIDVDAVAGSDKYERQSQFMKRLMKLAQQTDVAIILVAHKRKNGTEDAVSDVSGSADIGNLATLMINFSMPTKKDLDNGRVPAGASRVLTVPKERLFGRTDTEGFGIFYDKASRRLYGEDDDPAKSYGWDGELFEPASEQDEKLFELNKYLEEHDGDPEAEEFVRQQVLAL